MLNHSILKLRKLNKQSTKKTQVSENPYVAYDNSSNDSRWSSRSRLSRILYIIIVCLILAGFSYHIYVQVGKYLNYPVIMVSEKTLEGVAFPDITVCSISYFDKNRDRVFKLNDDVSYKDTIFQQNLRDIWRMVMSNTANESMFPGFQNYSYIPMAKHSFLPTLATSESGARIEDLMTLCRYGGQYCDFFNFTNFYHPTYGPCFQFSPKNPKLMLGGVTNGLVMNFLSTGKTLIDLRKALTTMIVGYKLFLHPRGTWPNLDEVTAVVNAKEQITVAFDYTLLERLSTPTKLCSKEREITLCRLEYPNGLVCKAFNKTKETQKSLEKQKYLYKTCNCISYEWPISVALKDKPSCFYVPPKAYLHSGFNKTDDRQLSTIPLNNSGQIPARLTSLVNLKQTKMNYDCYNAVKLKVNEFVKTWRETPQCLQESYKLTKIQSKNIYNDLRTSSPIVTARHPQVVEEHQHIKNHLSKLNRTSAFVQNFRNSKTVILSIYLKSTCNIYVFPQKLTSLISKEYYLYDVIFFLADAGGLLGLWVGFSLFTIFKVVDWIILHDVCKSSKG